MRGESSQRRHSKSKIAPARDSSLPVKTPPEVKEAVTGGKAGGHFYGDLQTEGVDVILEGRPHPLLPPGRTSNPRPDSLPGEQGHVRKPGHSKTRFGSRYKVSPMLPDGMVQQPSVPTSPGMFISQDNTEDFNSNSALSPSVVTAWRSLVEEEGKESGHGMREGVSSNGSETSMLRDVNRESVVREGKEREERGEIGQYLLPGNSDEVSLRVVKVNNLVSKGRNEAGGKAQTLTASVESLTKEMVGKGRKKNVSRNGDAASPTGGVKKSTGGVEMWRGYNQMEATPNGAGDSVTGLEQSLAGGDESSESALSVARGVTVSGHTAAVSDGFNERFKTADVVSDVGEGHMTLSEDGMAAGDADNGSSQIVGRSVGSKMSTRARNGVPERTSLNINGSGVHSESGRPVVPELITRTLQDAATPLNNNHSHHSGGGSSEGVYIPSPRSHQSDGSYDNSSWLDNSLTHQDHIRSIQQESLATLVTVSPAPRESRSSFEVHGLSKLSLAEAHGKLYNFRTGPKSHGGVNGSDALIMKANWEEGKRGRDSSANLVDVPPQFINVSSIATERVDDLSPQQLSTSAISVGEAVETPVDIETSTTHPRHGNHGPNSADGAVTMATHENEQSPGAPPVVHMNTTVGHRMGTGVRGVSVSSDVKADKGHLRDGDFPSPHETTFSPAYSVVQATPAVYTATVTSVHSSITTRTSGLSVGTLKAINLPPLKGVACTDIYVGKFL